MFPLDGTAVKNYHRPQNKIIDTNSLNNNKSAKGLLPKEMPIILSLSALPMKMYTFSYAFHTAVSITLALHKHTIIYSKGVIGTSKPADHNTIFF